MEVYVNYNSNTVNSVPFLLPLQTYMCKWCGTRYCKECLRGAFGTGLMTSPTKCRQCNQVSFNKPQQRQNKSKLNKCKINLLFLITNGWTKKSGDYFSNLVTVLRILFCHQSLLNLQQVKSVHLEKIISWVGYMNIKALSKLFAKNRF